MMAIAAMTQVAGYERNRDFENEAPEPGVIIEDNAPGQAPELFDFARQPFQGLRAVVTRLTHHWMPTVPGGPAIMVADRGADARPGRKASSPIRAASVYVPVAGVEQTAAWYDYASPTLL
jgi:hypothetical protein